MVKIDIDMPKSCEDCPLIYDMIQCCVTRSNLYGDAYGVARMPDCPLMEIEENQSESGA